MNKSDIELVKALLQRIRKFDDGCGCCATEESKDTEEYKALERRILELEESNPQVDRAGAADPIQAQTTTSAGSESNDLLGGLPDQEKNL